MSDRVGYVAGNTIHRDHLWGATILRSEIETYTGLTDPDEIDNRWPVDITLAQAMAMYWRVKKWTLSGSVSVSLTYDDNPGTSTPEAFDASGTLAATDFFILDSDGNEATNEHDILSADMGAPFHALYCGGIGNEDGFTFPWTAHRDATTESSANSGSAAFIDSGYSLYDIGTQMRSPPMSGISGSGTGGAIIGGTILNLMLATVKCFRTPVTVLSGTGPVTLKKPGTLLVSPGIAPDFTIPLQLSWRPTGEAVGSAITDGAGSAAFTMTATEFWPYATSANLPVYNSSSGAQINSPFA